MRDPRLQSFSFLASVAVAICLLSPYTAGQEVIPNPFDYLPPEAADTVAQEERQAEAQPVPGKAVSSSAEITAFGESTKSTQDKFNGNLPADTSGDGLPDAAELDDAELNDAALDDGNPPAEQNANMELPGEQRGAGEDDRVEGDAVEDDGSDVDGDEEDRGDQLLDARYSKALVISVEGPIFGRFHWYLNNRLDAAKRSGVDLVIIRLTTPGGDLEQSLQLARRLRDIDWATTVVYIPEEAISGGAIISLGAERIIMQNGALIGDAGPIRLGLDGQFREAEQKIVSYLASAIRELANAKGRPAALAEAMVDRRLTLYQAIDPATGNATVLTEKETQDPEIAERYEIGKVLPESGQDRYLTLSADRAAELELCEGVFASQEDFLASLHVDNVEFTRLNWVDRTVYLLNRPWLTALLLIVGLVGLYFELIAPGISVAGLTSCFCFGIFFWSHALGGTSGWLEVLLFVLGILCVILEMFVIPGFGVFGITGIALVVLSLVMASQDFLVPSTPGEWTQLQTNSLIVLGAVLGVLLLVVGQVLILDSLPGLNRFRLAAPEDTTLAAPEHSISIASGVSMKSVEPLTPGESGVAESDLRPSGKILINQRLVDVVTEGDYVDSGSRVEVIRVEGNRVVVRKL